MQGSIISIVRSTDRPYSPKSLFSVPCMQPKLHGMQFSCTESCQSGFSDRKLYLKGMLANGLNVYFLIPKAMATGPGHVAVTTGAREWAFVVFRRRHRLGQPMRCHSRSRRGGAYLCEVRLRSSFFSSCNWHNVRESRRSTTSDLSTEVHSYRYTDTWFEEVAQLAR